MRIMGQDRFIAYTQPLKEAELAEGGELLTFVKSPASDRQAVLYTVRRFLDGLTPDRRDRLLRIAGPARGRRPDIVAFQVQFVVQFVEDLTGKYMNGWREPLKGLMQEIGEHDRRLDLQSILALIALELFWREWEAR